MNSIHEFLRRILPNPRKMSRDEFSFELLRSASARELKKRNCSKQQLMWPWPSTNHDHLHISTPKLPSEDIIEILGGNGEGMRADETALLGFIENSHINSSKHTNSPTCSSHGVELLSEESTLERVIAECNVIRANQFFSEGVLLKCVDAMPLYMYLHYALFKNSDHDLRVAQIGEVIRDLRVRPKSQFDAYDEIYVIQKSSPMADCKLPSHRNAGYIAVLFKLLDEQTKPESLEKSWLSWSGAREIYKYSPRNWNLRRIALHKIPKLRKVTSHPFVYVLLCEFSSIMHPSNRLKALDMVERLRVRNCGYISLYQVHWSYGRMSSSPEILTHSSASNGRKDRNPMLRGYSQEVELGDMLQHCTSHLVDAYDKDPLFHSYHQLPDFG